MKRYILLAIAAVSMAYAREDSFSYLSLGASETPAGRSTVAPDLSIGHRIIAGKHALDLLAGAQVNHVHQTGFAQASYLFYPYAPNGLYLGVGVRGSAGHFNHKKNPMKPVAEVPLTLGVQFDATSGKRHFIQVSQGLEAFAIPFDAPGRSTLGVHYGFEF